jgi:hypothetical protein
LLSRRKQNKLIPHITTKTTIKITYPRALP